MACDSGTAAGIFVGTFFGTLVIVAAALGVAFIIWRRKQRKVDGNKKAVGATSETYDNPAFHKDTEHNARSHNGEANKAGNALTISYTEIQERESGNNNKALANSTGQAGRSKARRNLFADSRNNAKSLDFPIQRAGSHGSLDGAVTPNYPEVIKVSLQSQDIIGLGFNISGSLSEGIFVSQVHNRGPASESGKVQVGDRILSITISMKNMVYEDALTILSYASPYPVILQLQKAMPLPNDDDLDMAKLNHPVYRSQSMDDLSKINRDRWSGPRKTWTQIRRHRPSRDQEDRDEIEGQLKKWGATHNIVNEESTLEAQVNVGDGKSSASNLSTADVSLDMDEMLAGSMLLTSTPGSAQVLQVHVPDGEHGSKRRSSDASDNISTKRLRDSGSDSENKERSQSEKVEGGDGKKKKSKTRTGAKHESDSESADETIPKGGIAYYVRIDEGLAPPEGAPTFNYDYNPKGIMSKPQLTFSDGTVATTSDPVEIANLNEQLKLKQEKERERMIKKQLNGPGSALSRSEPHLNNEKTFTTSKVTAYDDILMGMDKKSDFDDFLMQIRSQDSEA